MGRTHELTLLQAGLERCLSGRGAAFLISGEPGIGKTRLADEVSTLATRQGFRVFWGRCWQGGGAPAFWPWVQILRSLSASELWPQLTAEPRPFLSEIAQLLPDAGTSGAIPLPRPQSVDPEQARFRLFDSVTRTAKWLAACAPLALVLDDIHDADLPSLLLLRFLAREIRDAPILLLGTYRDIEARRSALLAPVFGQLARESQHLQLSGLNAAQVEQFIDESFHQRLPRALKAEVFRATEGNPFYVDEVARLLVARTPSGKDERAAEQAVQIPDTVRAAIRERLVPLSERARRVLTFAAVLGRDFDPLMIERLLPLPDDVVDGIEEAIALGIVHKPTRGAMHSFAHALIRDTIHDDLSVNERVTLHLDVADELERRSLAGADIRAAELAHHFLQALPTGSPGKAAMFATRAGDEALQQLAYEDAVHHYKAAQLVLDQTLGDATVIAELLLKLGDAQRWAGDLLAGRNTFQRVATIARQQIRQGGRSGAAPLLARAALGYARVGETGQVDRGLINLLEEALAAIGNEDSAWRSRLLARLAVGLYFSDDDQRRSEYCNTAIAIAERINDRRALVNALVAQHFVIWGPDTLDERLRVAAQVVHLSEELGERETELEARAWRITDLLEAADVEAAWTEHQAFVRLAEQHAYPLYIWYARMQQSMYAALHGDFTEAERLAHQAAANGARSEIPNSQLFLLSQMLAIRVPQGRCHELEPQLQDLAERMPAMPLWRIIHVVALLQGGRIDEGRAEFRRFSCDAFAVVPRDGMWLIAMSTLAHACMLLDDEEAARVLYDLLLPYAARVSVAASAISSTGPVAPVLASLALVRRRPEVAEKHLSEALPLLERMRTPTYLTLANYHLALAITASDAPRSQRLLAEVRRTASTLGMIELERLAAARLGGETSPSLKTTDASTPREDPVRSESSATLPNPTHTPSARGSFRLEGDFWTIVFAHSVSRLKNSKGLRYLHHLLAHPDQEFHALDLYSVIEGNTGGTKAMARSVGDVSISKNLGDCGEVLDTRAIAAYKRRLRELQDQLDEAEEFNDLGRQESLQTEIDFLGQQLAAGTGLGGRQRRTGSHAEQARVNVTKAISAALKKIRGELPELGRILGNSVKTGTFCAYNRDPAQPLTWEL